MKQTVAELLNYLEKPENEEQIQHLSHLKNLEHVEEVKNIRGFGGVIAKFVLRLTKNHIEAFKALSLCKTFDDIAAFKQTKHYEKIKNTVIGDDFENLEKLNELEQLKNLREDARDDIQE